MLFHRLVLFEYTHKLVFVNISLLDPNVEHLVPKVHAQLNYKYSPQSLDQCFGNRGQGRGYISSPPPPDLQFKNNNNQDYTELPINVLN